MLAGYSELFGRLGRNPQSPEAFLFFFQDQINFADKGHELLQVLLIRGHLRQVLLNARLHSSCGKSIAAYATLPAPRCSWSKHHHYYPKNMAHLPPTSPETSVATAAATAKRDLYGHLAGRYRL